MLRLVVVLLRFGAVVRWCRGQKLHNHLGLGIRLPRDPGLCSRAVNLSVVYVALADA